MTENVLDIIDHFSVYRGVEGHLQSPKVILNAPSLCEAIVTRLKWITNKIWTNIRHYFWTVIVNDPV